jgi:hypothetical protein
LPTDLLAKKEMDEREEVSQARGGEETQGKAAILKPGAFAWPEICVRYLLVAAFANAMLP